MGSRSLESEIQYKLGIYTASSSFTNIRLTFKLGHIQYLNLQEISFKMNASISENYNHHHHRLWSVEPAEKCVVTVTDRDSTSDVENDHPYCHADSQSLNLQNVDPRELLQVGPRLDIATMQNHFSYNQADSASIDPILQNQTQPLSEISQRQNYFELQVKVVADLVDFDADTDMDGEVLYNKLKGSQAETPPLVQPQDCNKAEAEAENLSSFGMQSAGVQSHQKQIEIASKEEIDLKWHIRVMEQMKRAFTRLKLMLNNSNSQSQTTKMHYEFAEFCQIVDRKLEGLKNTLAGQLGGLTLAGRLMEFDLHWYQVFFESELPAVKKQLENHNVFPSTVNSGSGEISSAGAETSINAEFAAFSTAGKFSSDNGSGDCSNGNYSKAAPDGNPDDDEMNQNHDYKTLLEPIHMEQGEDTPKQKPHTSATLIHNTPGTRRSNRQRVQQTWNRMAVKDFVKRNRNEPKTAIVKTSTGDGSGEKRLHCKCCHLYLTEKYLRCGHKRWCHPVPVPVVDTSIESPRSPLSIAPALQPT